MAGNLFGITGAGALSTNFYIALSSTEPQADGTGVTEPVGEDTGYARVPLTSLGNPVDGVLKNTSDVVFPKSLTDWYPPQSPAAYQAIFDGAGANAHLLSATALPKSRIVQSDTNVKFLAGELTISII